MKLLKRLNPMIEQTYKLDEVREALLRLARGHARGNLVITNRLRRAYE